MASKEYIGLSRITYIFGLLKNLFDAKADATDLADKVIPAYGTCSTAGNQRVKVVTIADSDWKLKTGCLIAVKFTNTNTYNASAGNPIQLNVNNSDPKNIYWGSSNNPTGTNTTPFGRANYVNFYVYDGTYWVWAGSSADNTLGAMSQNEATTGTATTNRGISAKVLNNTIVDKGTYVKMGTTKANATSKKLYILY